MYWNVKSICNTNTRKNTSTHLVICEWIQRKKYILTLSINSLVSSKVRSMKILMEMGVCQVRLISLFIENMVKKEYNSSR